ncbi:MAG: glycosyltransferase family 2 protein [Bacteroidales bacterium]|nr:glycosyltransferase family 2 protein [Bacteroidales bacterium]
MVFISVIIPCYNECGNLIALKAALDKVLTPYKKEYLFIDDGSTDGTLDEIKILAESDMNVKYISLSRNFGHQNALKAGIDHAKGDCLITMDADFQHQPEIILEMLQKWQDGYEIVYTIKNSSKNISCFKRFSALVYNKLFSLLSDSPNANLGADFRLIDRKIADILKNDFNEFHLFYRGLISWIGFNSYALNYTPERRLTGRSKYSYKRMGNFAVDGITSFSIKPLRIATLVGFIISSFAFFYGLYALYISFFTDKAITGWASVILSILFIGGIQLLFLGVIGEYLGKMFFEVKKRPHYLIKQKKIDAH